MDKQIRAFDLFCGAGGSSWGAALAGARIVGGVDLDPVAMNTYFDNFPEASWAEASLAESVDLAALKKRVGRVDLLLASPECTNHTHARGSAPLNEASRNKAHQVTRYAEALAPRWIIVENVVNMQNWDGYEKFVRDLMALGYQSRSGKLNAGDFGVPQSRRRLFIVFDNERQPDELTPLRSRRKLRTARDVVNFDGDYWWMPLRVPNRAKATLERARRARRILGDGTPFLIVYYGTDKAGGWQSLDVPLRTVTTLDRFAPVMWMDNEPYMRMLQVPELRVAMGFNRRINGRSFRLRHGTRRDQIRLLGNAVCPPVMAKVVSGLCRV